MEITEESKSPSSNKTSQQPKKPFTLKRWNLISTWAWDVECDTCAICRVHLMGNLKRSLIKSIPGF